MVLIKRFGFGIVGLAIMLTNLGYATPKLDDLVASLTLRQKVGQIIMTNLTPNEVTPFPELGNIILMKPNFRSAKQVKALTAALQSQTNTISRLIATDQEGGTVQRTQWAPYWPSLQSLGKTHSTKTIYKTAKKIGTQLNTLGINVNLAPVLDVRPLSGNAYIGSRMFSDNPKTVGKLGKTMIKGFHSAGIFATAKHFPGHGNTPTDSHKSQPTISITTEELWARDLPPFQSAINANVQFIMTNHIRYPKIDPDHPASLSKLITTGLLRRTLYFRGIIITDDLSMKAITNTLPVQKAAVEAFNAGADIILFTGKSTTQTKVFNALLHAVKTGTISEDRLNASVKRILKRKEIRQSSDA